MGKSLSAGTRGMRGDGRVGTIFWIVVLLAVILAAVRFVPVKLKIDDMKDYATGITKDVALEKYGCEPAVENVVKHAVENGLPLKPENVYCEVGTTQIYITLKYEAPIDFILFTVKWKRDDKVSSPKIN